MSGFIKLIRSVAPLFYLIFGNMLIFYLLCNTSKSLHLDQLITKFEYKTLQYFWDPILHITLAFTYYLASRKYTVYQITQATFGICAMLLGLYFFILLPAGAAAETSFISKYVYTSYYLLYSVWPGITLVLFYAYANERFSFKEAIKYYPLFCIFGFILSQKIMPMMLPLLHKTLLHENFLGIGLLVLALIGLNMYCCKIMEKNDRPMDEGTSFSFGLNYIITLGVLFVSLDAIKFLSVVSAKFPNH